MNNATEEFGFAPRDVYDGAFDLLRMKRRHAAKMKNLKYSDLTNISETFSRDCLLDESSHHVVAVQPHEDILSQDGWTIDFKSPRIAREVVGLMMSLEYRHLRDTYYLLHNLGSGMAGAIFEAIAHWTLSGNDVPQPIAMISDDKIPPTFSTPPFSAPPRRPAPPCKRIKNIVYIDLFHDLRGVTSDPNGYLGVLEPSLFGTKWGPKFLKVELCPERVLAQQQLRDDIGIDRPALTILTFS